MMQGLEIAHLFDSDATRAGLDSAQLNSAHLDSAFPRISIQRITLNNTNN